MNKIKEVIAKPLSAGSSRKASARYEFTGKTKVIQGHLLHQISYGNFRMCGWIESEKNVQGNATLEDESMVWGNAVVKDNAIVSDSIIRDNAIISNNAYIGSSTIANNARVSDHAKIIECFIIQDASVSKFANLEFSEVGGRAIITGNAKVKNSCAKDAVTICGRADVNSGSSIEKYAFISGEVKESTVAGKSIIRGKVEKSCLKNSCTVEDNEFVFKNQYIK